MFSKKPEKSGAKKPQNLFMNRKESSLWLGRAMSTSEVTLRALLQLLAIVDQQQQVIQGLYEKQYGGGNGAQTDPLADSEAEFKAVRQKLAELQEQLKPVLEVVDQACTALEKEL